MASEGFTWLAVVEARDRFTPVWEKMTRTVEKFGSSTSKAAEQASAAGAKIDESLLRTASGADAMELATAKVDAAAEKLASATEAQANAERALLAANAELTAGTDDLVAAQARQADAAEKLAAAETKTKTAERELGAAQAEQKGITEALAGSQNKAEKGTSSWGATLSKTAGTMGKMGLAIGGIGALSVRAAGNFESASEHLVTDAGESQKAIDSVRAQMLQLSVQTGTTADELVNGMYHIESSGVHGAAAMHLLTIAAQGAKVGGADLDTTTRALMGTMLAYGYTSDKTTGVMNALIATTASGDLRMQDLAGALSNVAPVAATAGISLDQVGGAIATMTAQGFSADRATQDLANSIGALQKPNNVAISEMAQLGINANDVSENLGKRGLTGTLDLLVGALASHTKNGQIFIDTLKNSQFAAQNLKSAIAQLPPNMQKLAQGLIDGKVTAQEWNKAAKDMGVGGQNLSKQFLSMVKQADSFNQLMKSGKPEAQSFNAALSDMMGGATGLKTALMLTGTHTDQFKSSVDSVGQSLNSKKKDVDNWTAIQGTFNQKMDQAKASVAAVGISIGTGLLPMVSKGADVFMKVIGPLTSWTSHHQELTGIIVASLGGFLLFVGTVNLMVKGFHAISNAFGAVKSGFDFFTRILGLSSTETATQAATAEAAAAAEDDLAASTTAAAAATDVDTVSTDANNVSMMASIGMLARAAFGFAALKAAQIAQAVASKAAAAAQWLLNAAMSLNPITIIIVGIAALVAGFIYLWTHCKWFRDFWIDLWHDIVQIISDVVGWIEGHWRLIISIIGGPIGLAVALVTKYWHDIVQYTMDFVHGTEAVLNWFASLPGKFMGWFEDVKNAAINKLIEFGNWLIDLPNKILHWIGDLGSLLYNVGRSILNGLWNGLKDQWNQMTGWISSIGGWISNLKGPIEVDAVLLTPHGHQIMQGLMKGMKAEMPMLQAQLGNITATIQGRVMPPGMAPGIGTLPTIGVSGGGGGGGGDTYIDFRGSTMMTEHDMDVIAEKLGNALGTRILTAGGLRLQM